MPARRKFLKTSFLSSLSAFFSGQIYARSTEKSAIITGKPVVVSTWDFGKAANAGAWKILSKGGRALDAVEQGVRIPEADPDNQSIGYGGLPDRDGFVTLDACIMDENYNCGGCFVCRVFYILYR